MDVTEITIRELSDEEAAAVSGGRFNPLNPPFPGSTGPTNPNEPARNNL